MYELHCSSLFLDLTSNPPPPSLYSSLLIEQQKKNRQILISNSFCLNCCLNHAEQLFPCLLQIQPLDAVLLASVKSRNYAYHSVVSTSLLLYLTHPTSRPLRRPLTVTLPCPPNPAKKKATRGQTEKQQDQQSQPVRDSPPWDHSPSHRLR